MSSVGRSALVLGATGATGKYVLKEALASTHFTKVGEYGRRVTSADKIPEAGKEKLEQKVIDFEKLDESGLKEGKFDVVFIALGTTRANAGGAAAFEKIDREYVLNAAKAARVEGADQSVVYLSSGGANASSSFLYMKSKGLTELGLAGLGYKETIVFRPGLLAGAERDHSRIAEKAFSYVTGALAHFTTTLEIKVPLLGKAIVKAGELGTAGLPTGAGAQKVGTDSAQFLVIGNSGSIFLGNFN